MWIIKLLFCILLLRDSSCKTSFVKTTTYLPATTTTTSIIIANSTESVSTMSATTDEPTTSAETTTAEKSPCQGGKSMLMKRDIQEMIKYYLEQSDFHQILDDGQNRLQQLVNNTADQIEEVVQWFHEKPEHLKHVLKVLADLRHSAEPYMQAIAYQLQYLPYVQKSYENNRDEFNKLVDKYKKLKEICQWTCQNHQNEHVYDRDGYDRQDLYGNRRSEQQYASDYELRQRSETIESNQSYYCTTLKDLNNKVNERVRNLKSSMENKIHAELALASKELNETLKKLKDELKDNALNKFGRPMYDILTVVDKIIHFNEFVGSVNVGSIIDEIENVKLGVENNLMELQRRVDFGKECSGCPYHQLIKRVSNGATYNMSADSNEKGDMINLLFDVVAKEKEDQFSQEVKQTIENLKGKMNIRFQVLHEYIYKAIEDHLQKFTAEESVYFQDMRASLQSFNKIQSLKQKYNSLCKEIEHYALE